MLPGQTPNKYSLNAAGNTNCNNNNCNGVYGTYIAAVDSSSTTKISKRLSPTSNATMPANIQTVQHGIGYHKNFNFRRCKLDFLFLFY